MKSNRECGAVRIALPVELQLVEGSGRGALSTLQTGITRFLSSEEVCFHFTPDEDEAWEGLEEGASLLIFIHFPRAFRPARVRGRVTSVEKVARPGPQGYTVRAVFVDLPQSERGLIGDYLAWVGKRPSLVLVSAAVVLGLVVATGLYLAGVTMVKNSLRRRVERAEDTIATLRQRLVDTETALLGSRAGSLHVSRLEAEKFREKERLWEEERKQQRKREEGWKADRERLQKELDELRGINERLLGEKAAFQSKVRHLDRTQELVEVELQRQSRTPSPKTVRITYKNGRTVSGTVEYEDESRIRLQTRYGPVEVHRKLIKHIESLPYFRGEGPISP